MEPTIDGIDFDSAGWLFNKDGITDEDEWRSELRVENWKVKGKKEEGLCRFPI